VERQLLGLVYALWTCLLHPSASPLAIQLLPSTLCAQVEATAIVYEQQAYEGVAVAALLRRYPHPLL
jgi:hypothetical protein